MTSPINSIYGDDCRRVLWTKRFKAGYILQREEIEVPPSTDFCEATIAYNLTWSENWLKQQVEMK